MTKRVLSIVIILLFIFILPYAIADGAMAIHDPDMIRWGILKEGQQYCAINYNEEEQTQNMILLVGIGEELRGDKVVWVFPVPSKPQDTDINIVKGFPVLRGYDLEDEAKDRLNQAFILMWGTQIYPLPLNFFMGGLGRGGLLASGTDFKGVEVHERVEKMGVTSELLSTASEQDFINYLESKNLDFPEELDIILREYIGQDYSFVITWISDVAEFKSTRIASRHPYEVGGRVAVYLSFKTDKIFYPLKPTSVYGDTTVPTVIYVMDYVNPEVFNEIKEFTHVDYFYQSIYQYDKKEDNGMKDFFFGETNEIKGLEYTKIKINAPSNQLVQDLWIGNEKPGKVVVYESLYNRIIWWTLIIFILISCLASLIAGLITFGGNKPSPLKFFLFGLFNFLTLVGLWLAAYVKNIDYKFTNNEHIVFQDIGLSPGKKASITIPVVLLIIFILMIPISFLLDIEILIFPTILSFLFFFFAIPVLIFLPLILWGIYRHKRILVFNILFGVFFFVLLGITRLIFEILI